MKKVFAVALVLAFTLSLSAQQNPDQKPSGGKPAAGAQKAGQQKPAGGGMMTKPSAEMQKLRFMVGKWNTSEKMEANEFMPQPLSGTGRAEIHPGPGRLSMIENYQSFTVTPMGKFSGHAVLWWDAKAQQYKSFWCDSMAACETGFGVGKWEGDKLVFTGETQYEGKKVSMRQTFSEMKPDSFTWSEESSIGGGPMKPSMTIQYTRISGPKPAAEKPNPKM